MRFNKQKAIQTAEKQLKSYYEENIGPYPEDVPFWKKLFKRPSIKETSYWREIRKSRGMRAVRLASWLHSQGILPPKIAL
ncbi:hypothetical protein [Nitrosomonas communis]|uniref:hypothetical protein n=1 Tax=Nitrosomonas communis TaxID=44574 RepID=UPI0026EC7BA9|nr:hypothetical protein [Nitrosomonas communis]MCO6428177.1 hypothetical protein [Nitrosomonas communis]